MFVIFFLAHLTFSGPWENISKVWHYLLLQLNLLLTNQTLSDHFSISCSNPVGGSLTLAPYLRYIF